MAQAETRITRTKKESSRMANFASLAGSIDRLTRFGPHHCWVIEYGQ